MMMTDTSTGGIARLPDKDGGQVIDDSRLPSMTLKKHDSERDGCDRGVPTESERGSRRPGRLDCGDEAVERRPGGDD
jgi:hypothetical protein